MAAFNFFFVFVSLVVGAARMTDAACVVDAYSPRDIRGVSVFSIDGINSCRCSTNDLRSGRPVCTRQPVPAREDGSAVCLRDFYLNPCQHCACYYGHANCDTIQAANIPGSRGECAYSFWS